MKPLDLPKFLDFFPSTANSMGIRPIQITFIIKSPTPFNMIKLSFNSSYYFFFFISSKKKGNRKIWEIVEKLKKKKNLTMLPIPNPHPQSPIPNPQPPIPIPNPQSPSPINMCKKKKLINLKNERKCK